MLTIWGRKASSNTQALMWYVGELGLDCLRFDVGHRYGDTDSEASYQFNPNRTVLVLQDDDSPPLQEAGAILHCLTSRHANDVFWPGDLLAHTEAGRQAEWSKQNVALGFTAPVLWRVIRTPAAERDSQAIVAAMMTLKQKLTITRVRLTGDRYLVGDMLTLTDIQFGHVLYRHFAIDITRCPLPHLATYYIWLAT